MRYLIDARETRENLRNRQDNYKILHFFFDYRAGSSMANNEHGLIKWFITQLCDCFEKVELEMARQNARQSIHDASLNRLLNLLYGILETLPARICAFIDGLDEYMGDFAELAQTLIKIQSRTLIKMCLASRPESAFQRLFGGSNSLVMQEHNATSIRAYIDHTISCHRDRLIDTDFVIDNLMREELLDRANGVMIWARLAVDELLRVAQTAPSKDYLRTILDELPEDLEQMYDRTFARIPQHSTSEAAILLFFVNELGGKVDVKVLQGLWSFLKSDCTDSAPAQLDIDESGFLERLRISLGSFIDVVDSYKVKKQNTQRGNRNRVHQCLLFDTKYFRMAATRRVKNLKFWGQFWGQSREVRLMHKTLQPYLQLSATVKSCLPEDIRIKYPDNVRSRLYADVIGAATNRQFFDLNSLDRFIESYAKQQPASNNILEFNACYKTLERVSANIIWRTRLDLLVQSIFKFLEAAHEQHQTSPNLYETWKKALTSKFMFFELEQQISTQKAATAFSKYGDCMDLRLAVEYGLPEYIHYIQKAVQQENLPRSAIWNALMFESVHVLWKDAAVWPEFVSEFPQLAHRHRNLRFSQMQEVISLIRAQCDVISIDLLVLTIKTNYYLAGRGRTETIKIIYELLLSMRSQPAAQDAECGLSTCDCKHDDHLLSFWAIYAGTWGNPWETHLQKLVVQLAKEKDGTASRVCGKRGTALHGLMHRPSWIDMYNWQGGVNTLILLAKLGADPTVKHNGRTPLQELRRTVWKSRLHPFRSGYGLKGLSIMGMILEHHEKYGSWPDFTPIVERWNLEGMALWEVDESGQIIYDDPSFHTAEEEDTLNINVADLLSSVSSISVNAELPPSDSITV